MKKILTISLCVICISSGLVLADCPDGDLTGDCVVNLEDLAQMASDWLGQGVIPYSQLTRADIAGMEAQMSTEIIDASNGNEFMPGTYFVYKTDAGRFGKFMVENYEPAENHRLTIRWVTYNADGTVYSQGKRLVIRGTWLCDLDEGLEIVTGADWYWAIQSSTVRRLSPQNGAKFKLMHRAIAPAGMVWVYFDEWSARGYEGYISKYETTNAQYCEFLNAAKASGDITVSGNNVLGANGSNIGDDFVGQYYYNLAGPGYTGAGATNGGAARINYTGGVFTVDSGFENHPVTYVSWYGATAFAEYYGCTLPTEWQWQAVADYDGSYNYGCGTTINNSIANYFSSTHPDGTTAVGAFGTYGYGMADMAGNVWEWTSSCYYSDCRSSYRVLRGGSWEYGATSCLTVCRNYDALSYRGDNYGFRLVLDLE
jgi:hypothetical protein